MTLDDFKAIVIEVFRASITEETDDKVIFKMGEQSVELDKNYFHEVIHNLDILSYDESLDMYNQYYYEVLVKNNSRIIFTRDRNNNIIDAVNGLEYKIDKPSDEYLLLFLIKLKASNLTIPLRRFFDPFRARRLREREQREGETQLVLFNLSIFDVLKESIIRFETLKISSGKELNKSQFEQYGFSYLFCLSYNLNYSIYPLRYFEEFVSPLRASMIRRSSLQEIDPPKRLYINDLVLHYQKGISSESPDNQFLSFYHIFEHFFEKVYNEDILDKIKNALTDPGFSYKRNRDIESLVKIIQNRLKFKNEEFVISEIEALDLTLRKYANNIEDIRNELRMASSDLIGYFKSNEVPFSKGNKVNFEIPNEDEIYKSLSKRIYQTRNSIVHSKDTEKVRYMPFKDDKDLIPEVYLMRILAEKVIIFNSKEI